MMNDKIEQSEVESLQAQIKKIESKYMWSYLGIAAGIILLILTGVYYAQNPDVVGGSISMALIAISVIVVNYISYKQRNKRVIQLNKDLKVLKERVEKE